MFARTMLLLPLYARQTRRRVQELISSLTICDDGRQTLRIVVANDGCFVVGLRLRGVNGSVYGVCSTRV